MARIERVQSSFIKGVLSPRLRGRIDFEGFFSGAVRLENVIVLVQGGALRRSGTRFVSEIKDPTVEVRLLDFEPIATQSYVLEVGPLYARFFTLESTLLDAGNAITAVNQGTKTFTITGDHTGTLSTEDPVKVTGSTGNDGDYNVTAFALNGANTDVTVREAIPDATADGNMAIPLEITTPYAAADLAGVMWAQSNDVLFLGHAKHAPREIQRTSATDFTIIKHDFLDGPYLNKNKTATTLTLNPGAGAGTITSGTTGVTVRASATTGINDDAGFSADDVDRLIRIAKRSGGGETWLKITGFTSTTEVTATLRGDDAVRDSATSDWRLGAWHGPENWPAAVGFSEERLWWGHTKSQPSTFFASKSQDFSNHEPNNPETQVVAASNAMNVTLATDSRAAIEWFSPTDQGMLIGTSSVEFLVKAPADTSLGPNSFEILEQTNHGSKPGLRALKVGKSTVFVQRDGRVIRDAAFNFDEGGFVAADVVPLAEHLFRQGITRLAFTQAPIPLLWVLSAPSQLSAFTVEPQQQVLAAHAHPIADASAGGGVIEDIAKMRAGTEDQLWLVYKRTINGVTKRYVEFVESIFEEHNDITDAFFVDSGLSGDISPATATSFSGFDHIEGEEVSVLVDGAAHPRVTVTGGVITLQRAASKIHVGLPTKALIETMPWDGNTDAAASARSTSGKLRRAFEVHIRFHDTVGAAVGHTEADATVIQFRGASDPMDQPVPRFTGVKSRTIKGRNLKETGVVVFNDQPLPFHVLSITEELEVHDG